MLLGFGCVLAPRLPGWDAAFPGRGADAGLAAVTARALAQARWLRAHWPALVLSLLAIETSGIASHAVFLPFPELLRALTELRPDAGIADVRLPPSVTDDGLRVAIEARRACPGLPVLVLVLSQYVEQLYARELLADQAGGIGYLLKDRVFSDEASASAVRDVAAGGTVLDPEVVSRLMAKRARSGPLAALTPREREVLSLMAEGRSNAAIAGKLSVTGKAVSKHASGIFAKLGLPPSDDGNRRVLAVFAYLNS